MTERFRARPPSFECPKCGSPSGFASAIPHYNRPLVGVPPDRGYGPERLTWACSVCGYEVHTRPLDHVAAEGS